MKPVYLILPLAMMAGCTRADVASEPVQPATEPQPAPAEVAPAPKTLETVRGPDGEIYAFKPSPERDAGDMIAGCAHMNPRTRPRGSNCFGIFPEQCGADRASLYMLRTLTPRMKTTIIGFTPTGEVRFISPGDAVTDDLRQGRLNIGLDENGVMRSADCY